MENEEKMINMEQLLKDLIAAVTAGCEIVRDFQVQKNFQKYQKNPDDFVTDADFKIQTMIQNLISFKYPGLNIVGEEDQEYHTQIQQKYEPSTQLLSNLNINRQVPQSDLCVWIDPIDSTSSFIKGQLHYVSILIGVSQKMRSTLGVIGVPYRKKQQSLEYCPEIIFSSVPEKLVMSYHVLENKLVPIAKDNSSSDPSIVVCCEYRQFSQFLKDNLPATEKWVSGIGYRSVQVIKGNANAIIVEKNRGSKWDICAGEAAIRALGGLLVDINGKQIEYDMKQNHININGIVGSRNKQYLYQVIKTSQKYYETKS